MPRYRCPECGSIHSLRLTAELLQDEDSCEVVQAYPRLDCTACEYRGFSAEVAEEAQEAHERRHNES
jgi:DNA-directed RNA polymerase subunit RPC12/RpoP